MIFSEFREWMIVFRIYKIKIIVFSSFKISKISPFSDFFEASSRKNMVEIKFDRFLKSFFSQMLREFENL